LNFGANLLLGPPFSTMEILGGRLSAQAGEPINVDTWPIYNFKATILRNIRFEFGGLLLSSIFQKIDWKFYFENLTDKLFVEWIFKTKLTFLRILPLKWYFGHDSTLSGSPAWADIRLPGISIVWRGGSRRRFAPKFKLKNTLKVKYVTIFKIKWLWHRDTQDSNIKFWWLFMLSIYCVIYDPNDHNIDLSPNAQGETSVNSVQIYKYLQHPDIPSPSSQFKLIYGPCVQIPGPVMSCGLSSQKRLAWLKVITIPQNSENIYLNKL